MILNSARHARALAAGFTLAALATASTVHAQRRVVYVDSQSQAVPTGASWQTAFRDLQDALAFAATVPERIVYGIEIRIAQGVYTPDRGTGDRYASFVPQSGIALTGGFAGLLGADPNEQDPNRFVSVLSGDIDHDDIPGIQQYDFHNSRTVVDLRRTDIAYMSGLTISGGTASSDEMPVVAVGTQHSQDHRIFLLNCVIANNWSYGGGIIRGGSDSNLFLFCSFLGNVSFDAPIIDCPGLIVERCTFRGNTIEGASSLLATFPANAALIGCLFADNQTRGSGLIVCPEASPLLRVYNCTFVAHPLRPRAAIWLERDAAVVVRNCIFAPGGLPPYPNVIHIVATSPSFLSVDQSVIMPNGDAGVYPIPDPSDFYHVLAADPRFVSPAGPDFNPLSWRDNDYHLAPGSPAIDRADFSDSYYSGGYADLNGKTAWDDSNTPNRGIGSITYADLGCYEYQGRLCAADFNASGALSPQDIFDFLNAWFAGDSRADFNGGGLSPLDIFDFLGAWFAGC